MKLTRFALAAASIVLLAKNSSAQNVSTADYPVVPGVEYCKGCGQPLMMDVFLPAKPIRKPTPAVLWLHGGGWERGDETGSSGARFLAQNGFVTASIYYRLSGEAKFPAAIEDCKCAVRYLRANAGKYSVDPDRIGVAGASAGAHLALLVATTGPGAGLEGTGGWPDTPSGVSAVSSYYGPSDFSAVEKEYGERGQKAIAKFLGGTQKDVPETYRRASPLNYVSTGAPPLLLVHGDNDQLVPFAQSQRMYDSYRKAGREAELVKVENADHDFAPNPPDAALSMSEEKIHEITVRFFMKHLAAP